MRPGRRAQWPSAARAGWPLRLILQSVAGGGRGHLTLTESTFTEKCCFLYERHDKFMLLLLFLEDITFEINSMGHTFFFIIFNSTHHRYWCCSNCKSSSNCFHHQELVVVAVVALYSSLLSLFQFLCRFDKTNFSRIFLSIENIEWESLSNKLSSRQHPQVEEEI